MTTGATPQGRERLAVSKADAAAMLGVSVDFFEDHVLADLRVVRLGRRVLVPLSELRRWLAESADLTLSTRAEKGHVG